MFIKRNCQNCLILVHWLGLKIKNNFLNLQPYKSIVYYYGKVWKKFHPIWNHILQDYNVWSQKKNLALPITVSKLQVHLEWRLFSIQIEPLHHWVLHLFGTLMQNFRIKLEALNYSKSPYNPKRSSKLAIHQTFFDEDLHNDKIFTWIWMVKT